MLRLLQVKADRASHLREWPANFIATAVSSSQINLSWTASTDNVAVTGYLLERCQGVGCTNFAQIATSVAVD